MILGNYISKIAMVSVGVFVACVIASLCLGGVITFIVYKNVNSKKISDAKHNSTKILEDAYAESKAVKKEAILEAKEEALKIKADADEEIKSRRAEVQKNEDRLLQREDIIVKKEDMLDKRQESLDKVKVDLEQKQAEIEQIKTETNDLKNQVVEKLSQVASLSKEDAKKQLMSACEDEARDDAAKFVRDSMEQAKTEADKKAREIITLAIQKCAADQTQDVTVSVVAIPNEDVKGRIIGREGRNIKALEQATGVELIIDDTPDAITLSSFDPVRREIARISLEKLILDGRIHPARIEEIVAKVEKDMDETIREAGENAAYQAGINDLNPEMVKYLGRLKYRTSYGQNCLEHSLEVSYLAGLMAEELGANVDIAKRGGLLHDIGKSIDREMEGTHVSIGVDLAKKYNESPEVIHCIEAHHGGVEFRSIEAILVQAADAISSSRPGARQESLENYIKRLESLENIANQFKGVEKSYAIQAGREIRVIVKPEEISDNDALFMAKDIAKKIESELQYPGQIKVNVIREVRQVEYAK
jgi:ribonucrease Y